MTELRCNDPTGKIADLGGISDVHVELFSCARAVPSTPLVGHCPLVFGRGTAAVVPLKWGKPATILFSCICQCVSLGGKDNASAAAKRT